jgi:hypothetical protein
VESPNQNLHPSSPKSPGDIGGAWELIGLDACKCDDRSAMGMFAGPDNPVYGNFLHSIIQNLTSYFEIFTKNLAAIQIFRETAETGERVARKNAPHMADYIAFIIIFRRLD